MCYPVCGMVHIKEPLLLIGFFSCYLNGPLPYVWRHITVSFILDIVVYSKLFYFVPNKATTN